LDRVNRAAAPLNMATRGVPPNNTVPMSPETKVVERLTMTGPNTIAYEMTYSDPPVFTAPWTLRVNWTRDDTYEFFEYACFEGDVQVRNFIQLLPRRTRPDHQQDRLAGPKRRRRGQRGGEVTDRTSRR
jgi:hypothetical protein